MMNFIATGDGQFINLGGIVMIEDVSEGGERVALLTSVTGFDFEVKGHDADALFERIELLAFETDAAQARIRAIAHSQEVQS